MSQDWIEKAIEKEKEYFESVSDEQLEKDLKKSGYDYYKDIYPPENIVPIQISKKL